jgi:beta-N-acetylhexosaminidase
MNSATQSPTLREKIGQMLLIGFRGLEITDRDSVVRDLAERNLGGVVLFDEDMANPSLPSRNIRSVEQVGMLVKCVKAHARTPPLIAIDQEGGRVNRLKPIYGFPPTLSHEELGALNDPVQTYAQAKTIAKTLAGLGINFNLAPVVDVDANADNPIIKGKKRSFSSDPQMIARHAAEFIKAHHQHGIVTCVKHFPGHGSSRGDTHLGLVDVTRYWNERELVPYQRLIEAGLCDTVMTAHIFNANLDPQFPATLSRSVVDGLLRRRLGFCGAVLSDDLEMKAISSHFGLENALRHAIDAGVDVLCLGNNMTFDANLGQRAADAICRLVETGEISAARIDESFQRIGELKRRFNLH